MKIYLRVGTSLRYHTYTKYYRSVNILVYKFLFTIQIWTSLLRIGGKCKQKREEIINKYCYNWQSRGRVVTFCVLNVNLDEAEIFFNGIKSIIEHL